MPRQAHRMPGLLGCFRFGAGAHSNVACGRRGDLVKSLEGESTRDSDGGISTASSWYAAEVSSPSVRILHQACSLEAVGVSAAHAYRSNGALVWKGSNRCEGLRSDATAQRRASRRTDHCERPSAG